MKDNPSLQLLGHDGNIFAILGSASRLLKRDGRFEDAEEMFQKVQECSNYNNALIVISKYVHTELSDENYGVLEADDISVDTEFTFDAEGVTAYVNTDFDIQRRFAISTDNADCVDFYATFHPQNNRLTSTLVIVMSNDERKYEEVKLFPSEQKLITTEMENIARQQTGKNLKELYEQWKQEYGERQKDFTVKERRNQKYER